MRRKRLGDGRARLAGAEGSAGAAGCAASRLAWLAVMNALRIRIRLPSSGNYAPVGHRTFTTVPIASFSFTAALPDSTLHRQSLFVA
jgi:hypothetical protein